MVFKGDAPSTTVVSFDRAVAYAFASAGHAVVAPDYLGLGEGPGTHPYDDIPSEVTAAIDALRAAASLTSEFVPADGRQVLISGFSQGGPAAVAMAKAIQDGEGLPWKLGGVAAIAGPYQMSQSVALAATGEIAFASVYLSYFSIAWNRLHGLYQHPSDAFSSPYDQTIEALFDNEHTTEEIFAHVPPDLDELFTAAFLDELRHPGPLLQSALAVADRVCDWTPSVPVHLYTAAGDLDVPSANTEYCAERFSRHGGHVIVIDQGDVDHETSAALSLPDILTTFEGMQ